MNAPAQAVLHEQKELQSSDGTKLVAQCWAPSLGAPKAQVLIVHGYFEHAVRYRELAHALAAGGIGSVAIDLRGHGQSGGQRGFCKSFDEYLDDVLATWSLLDAPKRFIIAHSFGGLVALDLLSRRMVAGLDGVVLSNPFLHTTTPPPAATLFVGKLAGKLVPRLSLPAGVDAGGISHDPQMVQAYQRDPLVFHNANAGWFRESSAAQERVRGLTQISVPLLYLYSITDPVASGTANRDLSEQLMCPDKTVDEKTGMFHELFNEIGRDKVHAQVRDWLLSH